MGIKDLFKPEEQLICVDFNNPLRILYAVKKGSNILIKSILEEQLPDEIFEEGQAINFESLSEVIKKSFNNLKIKKAKVLFAIPSQSVVVRFINFAYLPEEELREAIRWELDRFTPFPAEDVYFDVQILDVVEREGNKEYVLLLVAVPLEVIQSYLQIFNNLKLDLQLADVSSFSAIRAIIKSRKSIPEETTLFLNSRYKFIDFVVTKNKKPFFFRSLIAREFFEEEGLDDLSKSFVLDNYLKEISQGLNLFYMQYPEERIERVILLGDNVVYKDFVEMLDAMFGLPMEISPLSLQDMGVQIKNKKILDEIQNNLPKWASALGLLFWGEV